MDHIDDGSIIHYPPRFGRGWIPAEDGPVGAIGPARAGAGPTGPAGDTRGSSGDSADGPPPGQGRREEGSAVPAEGQGQERSVDAGGWPAPLGWTPERKVRFLDSLAQHGNVRAACALVGISPEAAYRLRRRDFAFGEGSAAALVQARASVEQVLADRAIHGVEEHIWYRGELVGSRRRFDGRLLLAHLGRLDRMAEDQVAPARVARFDELLAVVAGAAFPADMADRDEGYRRAADPLLPMERERYVAEAGHLAAQEARDDALVALAFDMDGADGPSPLDWDSTFERRLDDDQHAALDAIGAEAGDAARLAAEADWAAWQARVAAAMAPIGGVIEGAIEGVIEGPEPVPEGDCEPPMEFKSLDCVNTVNTPDDAQGQAGPLYKPAAPPHPAAQSTGERPRWPRQPKSSAASSHCGRSPTASPAPSTPISRPAPSGRTTACSPRPGRARHWASTSSSAPPPA